MELKQIKRMVFGIGIILYSMTIDSGELLSTLGFIVVLSGMFYNSFNKVGSYLNDAITSTQKEE